MNRRTLKGLRADKGWTLQDASKHIGVSVQSLWAYENNKQYPRINIVYKIAQAYGVNIGDIFFLI